MATPSGAFTENSPRVSLSKSLRTSLWNPFVRSTESLATLLCDSQRDQIDIDQIDEDVTFWKGELLGGDKLRLTWSWPSKSLLFQAWPLHIFNFFALASRRDEPLAFQILKYQYFLMTLHHKKLITVCPPKSQAFPG